MDALGFLCYSIEITKYRIIVRMDKKLLINYIYSILYQLVRVILPVITVPFLQATIGAATIGISDFAGNISSWFILFGVLGVNVYGNRQIAKVRNDKENLSRTFFEILFMQFANMVIVSVFYALYILVAVRENALIYWIFFINILASAIDISWFYYGVEDFKIASIRNTLVRICSVGLLLLFIKSPEDLVVYTVIITGTELLGSLAMFSRLKKYITRVPFSLKDAYRNHFRGTVALFIPTIAINVYTLLDQSMLGFIGGNMQSLNLYKTAQSFVKMFLQFITSIGVVMLPRVTNVFYNDEGGREKAIGYIGTTFKIACALSIPMVLAMVFVSPTFFPWYLRRSPNVVPEMIRLVQISSPILFFIALSNVFGTQFLVPTGRTKEYTTSVITGAVVNFFLNLFLIPRFLGYGAAVASCIAELTVTLVQYNFVRNDLKLSVDRSILIYLLAGALMSAYVFLIGNVMGARILTNVVQAGGGVLVYALTLILLKEELFTSLLGKLLRRNNG